VLAALEQEHAAEVVAGYAVAHAWRDELAAHPMVKRLEKDLFSPEAPAAVTPDELRALVRRGVVLVKDGVYFAAGARSAAAEVLAGLCRAQPAGVSVSEIRQALGTTRKWVMPLVALLDEAGITVRHGDLRTMRQPAPARR
jgi:selenocysteine-specific elongation factor